MTSKKQKLTLGVFFNFRKGWMGGIIYIINLINALNYLDEEEQPTIILFYNEDLKEFLKDIQYPHMEMIQWNFPSVYKGFFKSWITRKNVFVEDIIQKYQLDGIYPTNDRPIKGKATNTKIVGWIPDLQHKFYPHFFGRKRTFLRERRIKMFLRNSTDLAVSSHDVENHFKRFYSIKDTLKIHKLRFVSIINDFQFPSINSLIDKYKIPNRYFIVSNQFTNHKNHFSVLYALKKLQEANKKIHVVFTGKMEFKGNEDYIKRIREMVVEFNIQDMVSFLGVIPRTDQLGLMKNSIAVIQPSLFEGWSTVIEDAKSLQVPVVASNLDVNIEQLGSLGKFFDPKDSDTLSDILNEYEQHPPSIQYESYDSRVKQFASDFLNIFKS